MSDLEIESPQLLSLLKEKSLLMVTAESCTGGLIAKSMTDYAGSSEVLWGGFVTYSNDSKIRILGVPPEILEEYGAVSEETVRAMARGAIQASSADCSVAVSGIAGPGGGSDDKPVGTVWISAALGNGALHSQKYLFSGNRKAVRDLTAVEAMRMLYKLILAN